MINLSYVALRPGAPADDARSRSVVGVLNCRDERAVAGVSE
jgi:hypothetical protein